MLENFAKIISFIHDGDASKLPVFLLIWLYFHIFCLGGFCILFQVKLKKYIKYNIKLLLVKVLRNLFSQILQLLQKKITPYKKILLLGEKLDQRRGLTTIIYQ